MSDKPFTNREIKLMFEAQAERISEVHSDVKATLVQAKLTNGRVGNLENRESFTKGGLAVLTVLVLPLLFIVAKIVLEK